MRRSMGLTVVLFICLVAAVGAAAADNASITGDGVRMRAEASTDANVVISLNKGTRVEVVNRTQIYQTIGGDSAFWYYVTYGKDSGFIFGRFLAIDPVAAPSFEPLALPGSPAFPFEDWGACPMECCAYREWSVEKETVVRSDRYETAPAAFTVKPGDWVTGTTGVVIVVSPGRGEVTTSMKLGNRQASPGDVVEYLTYQGEGFYKVWFKGQMLDGVEGYNPIVMKVEPVWVWWAEIKNKKGQIGWTNETGNFGHIYSCGD
jgi:hypothetical protein